MTISAVTYKAQQVPERLLAWLSPEVAAYAAVCAAIVMGLSGAAVVRAYFSPVSAPLPGNASSAASSVPAVARALNRSEPLSMQIPAIGVNAKFVSLDIKKDGSMQTPSSGSDVGWYSHSPTPGQIGPAIVAGHVDTKAGPAVFWNLSKLKPGDKILINRSDGSTAAFEVMEVTQTEQDKFPTAKVYGSIDYAGIRLITCGGTFSQTTKHYSHNTIVYGSLVTE